jgi:hypothetical protein
MGVYYRKAYVKLVADGEFTHENVKGGHAENALKVLLGDKVKQPKKIYLDENGNLSDEPTQKEFKNPVVFDQTSETELKQIILSATQKGYKINVSSPSTYKGGSVLSDQHIINIGVDNYMSFKHAYTLTAASEKEVKLFNPHGDDEKPRLRNIFDKKTQKAYEQLLAILPSKGKLSPEIKEALEAILNKNEALKKESDKIVGGVRAKINGLEDSSIAKGFKTQLIKIDALQDLSYKVLKEYFSSLVLTLIKK